MQEPTNRELLAYFEARIGEATSFKEHIDQDRDFRIDIGVFDDRPEVGLTTYSTFGLSRHEIGYAVDLGETRLRVEIAGVAVSASAEFEKGIATCGLNVASGFWDPRPGVVLPGAFRGGCHTTNTPHALVWYPFSWEAPFQSLAFKGVRVEWLQVIPITEDEYHFVANHESGVPRAGVDALIDKFELQRPPIYDLWRASVFAKDGR